jgi:hypothetical protein
LVGAGGTSANASAEATPREWLAQDLHDPVAHLPLRCADGAYRRYPGRQVVLRDPSGAIAAVAGAFTRTVTSDAFVPSLYPVDDELGDGDIVVA